MSRICRSKFRRSCTSGFCICFARPNTVDRSLSGLNRRPMVYSSFRLGHDLEKSHTRLRPKEGDIHFSGIGKNNRKRGRLKPRIPQNAPFILSPSSGPFSLFTNTVCLYWYFTLKLYFHLKFRCKNIRSRWNNRINQVQLYTDFFWPKKKNCPSRISTT